MSFLANTKITIASASGDTKDEYGDSSGDAAFGSKRYPASVIERSKTVVDPASGEARTVRFAVGRVKPGVPVSQGDRIKSKAGKVYVVDEVTETERSIAGAHDVRLDLRII